MFTQHKYCSKWRIVWDLWQVNTRRAQMKVDQGYLGAARQVGNRSRFLRTEGRLWRQVKMWLGFWNQSKLGLNQECALDCDPKHKETQGTLSRNQHRPCNHTSIIWKFFSWKISPSEHHPEYRRRQTGPLMSTHDISNTSHSFFI